MMNKHNPKEINHPFGILKVFFLLGVTSFGGPVAHIGFFQREFVERRRWLSESQFAQLLAICQFLPGPASSQLGFGIGLLRGGWLGALAAFVGFTLPSAIVLFLFALGLPMLMNSWTEAALHGLKILAFVVVFDAVKGMASKLCPDVWRQTLALTVAAVLIAAGAVYWQLLAILVGAAAGLLLGRETPTQNFSEGMQGVSSKIGWLSVSLFSLLLVFSLFVGQLDSFLLNVFSVFYQAGALVFGGGHVVLPWLEASTVSSGLITQDDFLAGYGFAQAVPGPLFTFAAYLGALWPSQLSPMIGASIALLFVFLPGFLLLVGVLPFWKNLSANPNVSKALSGINAAVVGVLGSALFNPIFVTAIISPMDMVIALAAFWLIAIKKVSVIYAVVLTVLGSIVFSLGA